MSAVLLLGFLIGMQHALEVDHVAAVASLAARARSVASIVKHGAAWGLGHALTLAAVGGLVILLGAAVPDAAAEALELAVGLMLILLGGDVIRRLLGNRIHVHVHRHPDGTVHMHAHGHAGESAAHDSERHEHDHRQGLPLRTLLVGMMHGMAGSAALLVVALASVRSPWLALLYVALFGLGSVVGMAALSAVIALPLSLSARFMTWSHRSLQAAVGGGTVLVGGWVVYGILVAAWAGA